ncbi:hypothetical protein [Nonomuraea zeae]|uniref:Uncharacterized protein n=1 Tax=Nonomuraea zeae TaxID=1642303 RepID=A0A5S4H0P8_9ACTN|nr:hypothetical protein [Nonomuraea zeae]TMR38271.1 hypothetical protein ETD85_05315 [Nonomuraea zeae]
MMQQDVLLDAVIDALDASRPWIRYRIRRFPEGEPYLRLTVAGCHMIVFVQETTWFCLSWDHSGVARLSALGDVSESPQSIVERLRQPAASRRSRSPIFAILGRLAAAAMVVVTATVVIGALLAVAVPAAGYSTARDTVRIVISALAIGAGLIAGGWTFRRLMGVRSRCRGGRR